MINLLDERVWNLTPYFVSYTVSKMGLWTLTRTMALALAPRIRVNAIGPGPTLPNMRQTPAQFLDRCRNMPLRRGTGPREIAAAMRFILEAPAMTGQMIALDGGEHLGWARPGHAPDTGMSGATSAGDSGNTCRRSQILHAPASASASDFFTAASDCSLPPGIRAAAARPGSLTLDRRKA